MKSSPAEYYAAFVLEGMGRVQNATPKKGVADSKDGEEFSAPSKHPNLKWAPKEPLRTSSHEENRVWNIDQSEISSHPVSPRDMGNVTARAQLGSLFDIRELPSPSFGCIGVATEWPNDSSDRCRVKCRQSKTGQRQDVLVSEDVGILSIHSDHEYANTAFTNDGFSDSFQYFEPRYPDEDAVKCKKERINKHLEDLAGAATPSNCALESHAGPFNAQVSNDSLVRSQMLELFGHQSNFEFNIDSPKTIFCEAEEIESPSLWTKSLKEAHGKSAVFNDVHPSMKTSNDFTDDNMSVWSSDALDDFTFETPQLFQHSELFLQKDHSSRHLYQDERNLLVEKLNETTSSSSVDTLFGTNGLQFPSSPTSPLIEQPTTAEKTLYWKKSGHNKSVDVGCFHNFLQDSPSFQEASDGKERRVVHHISYTKNCKRDSDYLEHMDFRDFSKKMKQPLKLLEAAESSVGEDSSYGPQTAVTYTRRGKELNQEKSNGITDILSRLRRPLYKSTQGEQSGFSFTKTT